MPKLNKYIKKTAQKKGFYLGAVMTLITLGAYLINWDILLNPWFQISKFVFVMVFAILAVVQARRLADKYAFRHAFSAYFITVALGLIILAFVNFLLLGLIDSQAGHYITEISITQRQEQLQMAGRSTERVNEAIKLLKQSDPFSLWSQLQGYIMNLVLYCLPGIIIALIFKKKKPIIV